MPSENSEFKGPIISVRGFVNNKEGKILLVKRAKDNNYSPDEWSLPGGAVNYTENPDESIIKFVKEKTGLDYKDPKFIYYQNSLPVGEGLIHCLNMYFGGEATGDINLTKMHESYVWATLEEAKIYNLAFKGNEALTIYNLSRLPDLEKLALAWDEAGKMEIAVTRDTLTKLHAYSGFFEQLRKDWDAYEEVRIRVNATLSRIKQHHKRNGESIITQIESRTKTLSSIMEKMIRKGETGIPRHYTTFDDMAGARAIVTFKSDIGTVIKHFEDDTFYKIRRVEDYITNPKPEGYRGIHLILEVPLHHLHLKFVPRCEVQLRTTLQHAWARASHDLTYKREKSIPQDYLRGLQKLSETLTNADQITEDLREKIERERELKKC